jgi:DsbC/DsbD-like thiol-disulfide interchange protein
VQLDVYQGPVEFVVPITLAPTREGRAITITGYLRYQACTDSLCLPPAQHQVEAALNIEPQMIPDATRRGRLDQTD